MRQQERCQFLYAIIDEMSVCLLETGSGKPWRKIFVVVEGIYSMEGQAVQLVGFDIDGTKAGL